MLAGLVCGNNFNCSDRIAVYTKNFTWTFQRAPNGFWRAQKIYCPERVRKIYKSLQAPAPGRIGNFYWSLVWDTYVFDPASQARARSPKARCAREAEEDAIEGRKLGVLKVHGMKEFMSHRRATWWCWVTALLTEAPPQGFAVRAALRSGTAREKSELVQVGTNKVLSFPGPAVARQVCKRSTKNFRDGVVTKTPSKHCRKVKFIYSSVGRLFSIQYKDRLCMEQKRTSEINATIAPLRSRNIS